MPSSRKKKLKQRQKQKQKINIRIKNVVGGGGGGGGAGGVASQAPIIRDFTRPVWIGENLLPPPPRAPKLPRGPAVKPPDEIPPADVNMGNAQQIPEPPVILPPPAAPAQGIAVRSEPARPLAGIMKPPPFPKKIYVSEEAPGLGAVGVQRGGRTTHHPFPWPPMQDDYKPPPEGPRLQPLARIQFLPGGGSMQGAEPPPPRNIKMREFGGPSRLQLPQPTPKPGEIELGAEEKKSSEPISKSIVEKGRRVPQPEAPLTSSLPRLNVAEPSERFNVPRLSLADVPGVRAASAPLPSPAGPGMIPPRRGEPKPAMKIPQMIPVVTPLESNITATRALPAVEGGASAEESKAEAPSSAMVTYKRKSGDVENAPPKLLRIVPQMTASKLAVPSVIRNIEARQRVSGKPWRGPVLAYPPQTDPLAFIPRQVAVSRKQQEASGWGKPRRNAVPWVAPEVPGERPIGPEVAPGNPLTNPLAFVPRQVTLSLPRLSESAPQPVLSAWADVD